jgi:hypothetical protein
MYKTDLKKEKKFYRPYNEFGTYQAETYLICLKVYINHMSKSEIKNSNKNILLLYEEI